MKLKAILKIFLAFFILLLLTTATLALLPLSKPLNQKSNAARMAITNVNIVDIVNNQIRFDKTLVIKGGRIERILDKKESFENVELTINARGKFAIPGLWDMHSHLAFDVAPQMAMPLHIANGVTSLRDMQGITNINQDRINWANSINNGELLGPRLIGFATEIVGDNYDERNVLDVVDRAAENKLTFVKIYSDILEDRYFKLATSARKKGVSFAGHYPVTIDPILAANAGQKSFEHAHLFIHNSYENIQQLREYYKALILEDEASTIQRPKNEEILSEFSIDRFDKIVAAMVKNKTFFCPTHVTKNYEASVFDQKFLTDEKTKYIPPLIRFVWADDVEGMQSVDKSYLKRFHSRGLELTKLAHQKGVKLLAGTDTYDPYSFPGFSLHLELEQLVNAGLTNAEALATATINPAAYFELSKDYGEIKEGLVADIVLLNKNPLEDIRNTQDISAVVFNGALYSRKELDSFLTYVEEEVSGLAGISMSIKMILNLISDNNPEARNNPT